MLKARKPNRLKVYDYSQLGYYFVTICTANKDSIFGDVVKEKMVLYEIGRLVKTNLRKISHFYKEVEIDCFIIMPNHLHVIIIINVGDAYYASTTDKFKDDRTKMLLSKVIQQFKRACTIEIKEVAPQIDKLWQRSFYDRIIRNEKELFNIRKYIQENPLRWDIDKNIPENLDLF